MAKTQHIIINNDSRSMSEPQDKVLYNEMGCNKHKKRKTN